MLEILPGISHIFLRISYNFSAAFLSWKELNNRLHAVYGYGNGPLEGVPIDEITKDLEYCLNWNGEEQVLVDLWVDKLKKWLDAAG